MAKSQKCKKVYITNEGKEVRSAASAGHQALSLSALQFRFADGTLRTVTLDDFTDPDVQIAATWHGISQKLGDSYSAKDGEDAIAAFDTAFENLKNGMWVEKGEGAETAPGMLVDAVLSALEKAGTPGDRAKIEAKLSPRNDDGSLDKARAKEARAGALNNPAIKAEYETAKANRAAERANKAKADAKGAETDLSAFTA